MTIVFKHYLIVFNKQDIYNMNLFGLNTYSHAVCTRTFSMHPYGHAFLVMFFNMCPHSWNIKLIV